jgi:hypothetical protein
MAIRFGNITVLCDATCKACEHRCSAQTSAALEDGQIKVLVPHGWTQDGYMLLGPNCTEERALQRAMMAEVPDPTNDPEPLKADREHRLSAMKEVVRADLEEREAAFPELREFVRKLVLKEGDVPDFLGHIGNVRNEPSARVEVRVRGNYVEISWPGEQSMSLTLLHENLEIKDPPKFMDEQVLEWVQNCLRTMVLEEVPTEDEPVPQ